MTATYITLLIVRGDEVEDVEVVEDEDVDDDSGFISTASSAENDVRSTTSSPSSVLDDKETYNPEQ